jgi:hypothetical protein
LLLQIGALETGVLNIKSVLTRNTDPGLIAMTGVINLLVGAAAALGLQRLLCLLVPVWPLACLPACLPAWPACLACLCMRLP